MVGIGVLALGLTSLVGCQPEPEIVTIGIVNFSPAMQPAIDGFKANMEALGYIEGETIEYIDEGYDLSQDELNATAVQLVEREVDLILALTTPAARAAQAATVETQTPVVFVPVTDPVGSGLVTSLSEPGGNLTGVTNLSSENLRLDWLLKVKPEATKIFVPYNSNDLSSKYALTTATAASEELGVELFPYPVNNVEEMQQALAEMPEGMDAIFMLPDGLAISIIDDFVATALEHKIPLCVPTTTQVESGALLSYGLDLTSASQQAARLADQIIKGKKPAELPVEESEFFLAINLDTANLIGLRIPDAIINQADFIFPK
ncbi:MAG: ABC transporter substrate-binding protein [Anaerolineales bacterium]